MPTLKNIIPSPEKIENIIFDFGGVICDLEIPRTEEKFKAFGPPKDPNADPSGFEKLVDVYESGKASSEEFRKAIRGHYLTEPSDAAIDDAWNALLAGIPEKRIRLLEKLRNSYRIFLLSNSNEIHYDHYVKDFREKFGYGDFDELFEKAYFSYRIGMRKPDPLIFQHVLEDKKLLPAETLFIDDTPVHTITAAKLGMAAYHLKPGEDITELFA
jgi:glucose-1-phosphatase